MQYLACRPGVDFMKVGRKALIIEIALSKLGARRKARPTPLKSFSKVGRRAQKVHEIDPWTPAKILGSDTFCSQFEHKRESSKKSCVIMVYWRKGKEGKMEKS